MNKKFFAALASATMAFTASGSIAVFADDFVEEKAPVVTPGEVKPEETEVLWNEDNFGALVKEDKSVFDGFKGSELKEGQKVKTAQLKDIHTITLTAKTNGEIKGLEYFTGLTTFSDGAATVTNKTLDFSANTALESLTLTKATKLAEIELPEAFVGTDKKETYKLNTLDLENTNLTVLDLSKQAGLKDLTVKKSELVKLDLSMLTLDNVVATNNNNLKEVVLNNGREGQYEIFEKLELNDNSLETINLDYVRVTTSLKLGNNHIGALNLSKTKAPAATATVLGEQTFYVYEKAANVNLKETFSNLDVTKVAAASSAFDKETGVLDLGKATKYTYETNVKGGVTETKLTVSLNLANPMNRLYNPNSGEHFYTVDVKEKEALVALGWNDEGYGWVADKTPDNETAKGKQAVYRLYNPNAGDHHYTMNSDEVKTLVAYGWKSEGTGWYSADDAGKEPTGTHVRVYRQYNPYANGAGSHNYTTDLAENNYLVSLGWTPEGTAWTALQ